MGKGNVMSEIFKLIPKIMGELGAVQKSGFNKHQNYAFRGIEQLYSAVHPLFVKHCVFCVPQVVEKTCETYTKKDGQNEKISFRVILKVNHKFYAPDGSFIEVVTCGEGIDTSDKATNKAMSGAMKYAFIELFSIPTNDVEDSDKESPTIEANQEKKQTSWKGKSNEL
jgi:hypothetical protein